MLKSQRRMSVETSPEKCRTNVSSSRKGLTWCVIHDSAFKRKLNQRREDFHFGKISGPVPQPKSNLCLTQSFMTKLLLKKSPGAFGHPSLRSLAVRAPPLRCKCVRSCKIPSCTYLSNGLNCTDMCWLQTCSNQTLIQNLTLNSSGVR